ncbi:hypothetical protein [Hyphobacterium marinum]|uniref:Prenyltransferase n=1 Tax=Hyphobacterium marinum TaxID=3116574 RepID=A0ABU7LZL1_9PROT|nr:hypothetical protein [Hyphobacterium sp. Y6023]MEE2566979.1 hypothetical protein [Hyphobacterium sp. Y6023]
MSALTDIAAGARRILALQQGDGAIPWIEAGLWDPWNHGEAVMALAIAGHDAQARAGLDCLAARQEGDGGWTGELGAGVPLDDTNRFLVVDKPATARDTNFAGYAAVTVLRTALALDAPDILKRYAGMVRAAMDFVASCQTRHGDIVWRAPEAGELRENIDSLRAGNACLYKSVECAIAIEAHLGKDRPDWQTLRRGIGDALHDKDWRFDRDGIDRRRYAMDWYYPVLAGVLPSLDGQRRLEAGWSRFVVDGAGCRCVADEPWITAAETAELALACASVGWRTRAERLIRHLKPLAAKEGGYWMGWQFAEEVIWPQERPGWTAAAVMLAADALQSLTPGSDVMIRPQTPHPVRLTGAALRAY